MFRNVLDIIGPVMIGPSSSHTAGAVRLGLLARQILGEEVARVTIALHGSFARTYKGHGTDIALLAGLMLWPADDVRIPEAESYARKAGMDYTFTTVDLGELVHPNTALFTLVGVSGAHCTVQGASVGAGQVMVTEIDGFQVALDGTLPVLLVEHVDKPGGIALVGAMLASAGINIAGMKVARYAKGGKALMVIECDEAVPPAVVTLIASLEVVLSVHFVAKI